MPGGKTREVKCAHISMQFSDTAREKQHDAEVIFDFAKDNRIRWITGTEAGGGSGVLKPELRGQAQKQGYFFYCPPGQACWVAVDRTFGQKFDGYYHKLLEGRTGEFAHPAKGVVAVTFETLALGRFTVMPGHMLTKGRPDAKNPEYRRFLSDNEKYAKEIGDYAVKAGKGTNKVWYGGDQNIVDKTNDTFLGNPPFVSCWDMLDKHPNTGHGNIDVIASSRRDKGVECLGARVFKDSEVKLFTDHFLLQATYAVQVVA